VARGEVQLNDQALTTGDGAAIAHESVLHLQAIAPTEVLLFDMAA